jgi:transcriptional regulator with XRE-family HTH domain
VSTVPSPDPMISMWAWLAYDLRFYRTRAHMSGSALCRVMDVARSSLSRLETGHAKLDEKQAMVLDRYWNTGGHFLRLLTYAKLGHDPDWFKEHVGYEARASVLRIFELALVPGLLQTEDYARALFEAAGFEDLDEQVAGRMSRQETLDRRPRPLLWILLTESVLDWPIGGPKVMRAQLNHLLHISELPNVIIRVVPRSSGAHIGGDGAFKIMTVPEGDVAYSEAHGGGRLILSTAEIRAYGNRYERIGAKALPEDSSRSLIEHVMETME